MSNSLLTTILKLEDNSYLRSGQLLDSNGNLSADWNNHVLTGGNWMIQGITGGGGATITGDPFVDTYSSQTISGLKDFQSGIAVSYISGNSNYYSGIIDSQGIISIDWINRLLYDGGGNITVAWGSSTLADVFGANSLDWNNRQIYDDGGTLSIDYRERYLFDINNLQSIAYNFRQLIDSGNHISIDWQNHILTGGTWNAQGLQVQGNSVVTSNQTGSFGGSTNTGQLTGAFYPLTGNPSGFITSSQTGNFASIINLSTTGNTLQTEITTLNNLTGSFVLTGNTGIFALNSNLQSTGSTLQTLINSLNTWTGISTGLYYPYSNNPSGYATTGYVLNNTTSNQPFYFQSGNDNTVSKYYGLISESLNTNITASLSAAVTLGGGQILLTGFITPTGEPNLLQIPAGLWLFNLYGSASSLTSTSYLVNSIYSYGTTGLETLLFTVTGGPLGSSDTLNSVYYISTGINLNTGDRLLSKVFALTNNALSTTITFNYQGAINPSHISSPLNYGYDYYTTKFVSQSQTGQFVTTGQTGSFGNGGTNVLVTGISVSNPDFSGIGGTIVSTSGSFVLISGAGVGGIFNTGTLVGTFATLYNNNFTGTQIISGNVGINNRTPYYTLDVSGSGNFTSGLQVNNNPVVVGQGGVTAIQIITAANYAALSPPLSGILYFVQN